MERTEDLFSFYNITSKHILEIVEMQRELREIRYWKDRNNRFRQIVSEMSEDTKWLLTFSVWFSLHNTRMIPAHKSRYYMIEPAQANAVTFMDFIKLIQQYNRKQISVKNEVGIVRFLASCDAPHFSFYLSLLSKTFSNSIPTSEVYDVLDIGCINLQEIYGPIEILQTDFSELTYPVAAMLLPEPDYQLCVHSREPRQTMSYYQNGGKLKQTKCFLTLDADYINTPRYTLVGYTDIQVITNRRRQEERVVVYPIDYFGTHAEFRKYMKNRKNGRYAPFKERMENLKKFLDNNYTRQIQKVQLGYAENEYELHQQVAQMYPNEGSGCVVLTDNNTARTGKALAVPVTNTFGVIKELWLDKGVPRGFKIWFNGEIVSCPFEFTGVNNAILNQPKSVHLKLLEFTYIKIGPTKILLGKKIHWESLQWKNYKHRSGLYIEKCVLCGGTNHPHKCQGLCRVCEINIRKYLDWYGPETWITPSPQTKLKRFSSGWEPSILNNMSPHFKEYELEAREDGCWRFHYREERAEKYHKYLKEHHGS